jgi:hypothetical protein
MKKAVVAPFHQSIFSVGHRATNFATWYENSTAPFFFIEYELGFEPYVVGLRHNIAEFWPHFRGFGVNKYSWFLELHLEGFSFAVLRDFFVFHVHHSLHQDTDERGVHLCLNYREYQDFFVPYLESKFGLSDLSTDPEKEENSRGVFLKVHHLENHFSC